MEKFNPVVLRELIRESGVTIDEIADNINISRSTLYNYLNGSTPITVEVVYKISNILELKNSKLFDENVLMRVLMNVPENVLMRDENEHKKEIRKVSKQQVKNAKSNYSDKLEEKVDVLNRQIGRLELENEQLKVQNAQLQGKVEVLEGKPEQGNNALGNVG